MIIITTLLKNLKLKHILPQSIAEDPNVKAISEALDPEFTAITDSIKHAHILSRIDELDGKILDLLAWQFHADFYDLTVPESFATTRLKREAVKNSVALHMRKGTVWAIKEALRQLDISAEFIPWWENGGKPYTFGLDAIVFGDFYKTSGKDILIPSILRAVNEGKAARSALSYINVTINEQEDFPLCVKLGLPHEWEILIRPAFGDDDITTPITIGIYPRITGDITVHPAYSDIHCDGNIFTAASFIHEWDMTIPLRVADDEATAEIFMGIYPRISGDMVIHQAVFDDISSGEIFAGVYPRISGEISINPAHFDVAAQSDIFCALGMIQDFDVEIGVDDTVLQDLLSQFEQRIFHRIEAYEKDMSQSVYVAIGEMNTQITEALQRLQESISRLDSGLEDIEGFKGEVTSAIDTMSTTLTAKLAEMDTQAESMNSAIDTMSTTLTDSLGTMSTTISDMQGTITEKFTELDSKTEGMTTTLTEGLTEIKQKLIWS